MYVASQSTVCEWHQFQGLNEVIYSPYRQNFRACGGLRGNLITPSRTRPPVGARLLVPTHCGWGCGEKGQGYDPDPNPDPAIRMPTAFPALSSPDNSEAGLRLRISFLFWLTIAQDGGNPPPVRMSSRLLVVSYRAPRSR